jgi:hypothetical protein
MKTELIAGGGSLARACALLRQGELVAFRRQLSSLPAIAGDV